ncbi:hypothetical protein N7475_009027 [Penicillium sp. IBT 31633x]|nr:hypothetical protein N7475_009027 [Penicillium sp. IBT 31633x]
MRLFKKKTSTNSTSSAGISSSVQRISQKSYASGENALAYPGREKVDVRAPYFFSKEPAPHSTDLIKRDLFRNISQTDRLINGHEVIAFYQITGGGAYRLPPNSTYQRQPWTVGIAINPFRAVQWSTGYMREKAAHWGIYIRPQGKSGTSFTRIFGMNWTRGYGSHLILEDVWGTPGQNNTGEWKKLLTDAEFDKTSDPMFKEITMYCSLEEFVLTVQWLLRQFTGLGRTFDKAEILPNPGEAYSLVSSNCQHFARYVITELKGVSRCNWTDRKRLSQPFDLSSLELGLLKSLERESRYVDNEDEMLRERVEKQKDKSEYVKFFESATFLGM